MKTDFGQLYAKQFAMQEDLRDWKRRAWVKLDGLHCEDILDGYEALVEQKPAHLPGIPEIAAAALLCQKQRKQQEANQVEAERVALLPPVTAMEEPVAKQNLAKIRALLAQAARDMGRPETELERQARLARLNEKRIAHEALLEQIPRDPNPSRPLHHKCAVSWCGEIGTISHSTNGSGAFFCVQHFRD